MAPRGRRRWAPKPLAGLVLRSSGSSGGASPRRGAQPRRRRKHKVQDRDAGAKPAAAATPCAAREVPGTGNSVSNGHDDDEHHEDDDDARDGAGPQAAGRGVKHSPAKDGTVWRCSSYAAQQACAVVARLLRADATHRRGASIKSLTLGPHIRHKAQVHALTCQTLQYLPVIKEILKRAELLTQVPQLPASSAYVLTYELLFGQPFRKVGRCEAAALRHEVALRKHLQALLAEAHAQKPLELVTGAPLSISVPHPRAARVNTLKCTAQEVVQWFREHDKQHEPSVDSLIRDLLLFPPGTQLHSHFMVESGSLILQSKASCMSAAALAPVDGWTVLDCCAAPGNKTGHLSALMRGRGKVIALDKDARRLATLKARMQRLGASNVEARQMDWLLVDPLAPEFAGVDAILCDPSCSGSGTVMSRMDHLLPSCNQLKAAEEQGKKDDKSLTHRIERLAKFQEAALALALSFPNVCRVVYSTCSINVSENEAVIATVQSRAALAGFKLEDPFPDWQRRGIPVVENAHKLVRVDPVHDGTDGFFLALFQRS